MDVLSDVLTWLRVRGTLTRRSEFSAPWGVAYPPVTHASFMVVERGTCVLRVDGAWAAELHAGDLLMLAPGHDTALADQKGTPLVPYARVLDQCTLVADDAPPRGAYPTLRYGGRGATTVIRGWGLRFEGPTHPLRPLLPPFIHVHHERRDSLPWLQTTLQFLLHELEAQRDGAELMVVRLVDLLFVQVLRAWFDAQPEGHGGWVSALRDPSIGRALQRIHQDPADAWTVDRLARVAGVSRSGFSARSQTLVGQPPMKYVTQWRMHLAATRLRREPRTSLAEVARHVGYDSESSFGRVFKRHFQVSPGAYRTSSSAAGPDQAPERR